MKYSIIFSEEANLELEDAFEILDQAGQSIANRFINNIEQTQNTILTFPKSFSLIENTVYRKAPIKGFPYNLIYVIYEEIGIILIIALFHTKRHPKSLDRRLE